MLVPCVPKNPIKMNQEKWCGKLDVLKKSGSELSVCVFWLLCWPRRRPSLFRCNVVLIYQYHFFLLFFKSCWFFFMLCRSKTCPAGRYIMSGGGTTKHDDVIDCLYCSKGKSFVNQKSLCQNCGAGTFQDSNSAATAICKNCPNGRFLTNTGSATSDFAKHDDENKCLFCVAGKRFTTQTTSCTICGEGKYQGSNSAATAVCVFCPTGRYLTDETSRPRIVGGKVKLGPWSSDAGEHDTVNDCLHCVAGKEFTTQTTICTICGAGTYQTSNNAAPAVCTNCPTGRYLVDVGWTGSLGNYENEDGTDERAINVLHDLQVDCLFCAAGLEFQTATTLCQLCDPGKVQISSTTISAACINCPEGKQNVYLRASNTALEHDANEDCTKCPSGYFSLAGFPNCIGCPAGFYQDQEGQAPILSATPCLPCPIGTYAEGARTTCRICPKGSYNEQIKQPACKHCAHGRDNDKTNVLASDHDHPINSCTVCPKGRYNDLLSIKETAYTYDALGELQIGGSDSYSYQSQNTIAVPPTVNHRSLLAMRGAIKVKTREIHWKNKNNDVIGFAGSGFNDYAAQYVCRSLNREYMYATTIAMSVDVGGEPVELAGGKSPWGTVLGTVMTGTGTGLGTVTMWAASCERPTPFWYSDTKFDLFSQGCTYTARKDTSTTSSANTGAAQYDILCGACKPGYTLITGASDLVGYCGPYFNNVDDVDEDCHLCPSGWYQSTEGSVACLRCAIGRHRTERGATDVSQCVVCEQGKYNEQMEQKLCKDCPMGRYGTTTFYTDVEHCDKCAHGKYNEQTGIITEVLACKNCGVGRIGNGEAVHFNGVGDTPGDLTHANKCKACVKGRYMDVLNLDLTVTVCKNCPNGAYGDQFAGKRCFYSMFTGCFCCFCCVFFGK